MKKTVQVDEEEYHYLDNPADRPLMTFDANVIIALRDNEADAPSVRQLIAFNHAGIITVNVALSTALEAQRPVEMHEYARWLQEQGIAASNIFTGPHTIGFYLPNTPVNTVTFDVGLERILNERVHQILFPHIPFAWIKYRDQECARFRIVDTERKALIELDARDFYIPNSSQAPVQLPTPAFDSLGLYNHLTQAAHTAHPEQAIFVTNDGNFLKQSRATALRKLSFPGQIRRPAEAVTFLHTMTRISLPDL